ncbi:UPF0175 family protein [Hydrogenobaculum sp.]|nr:hypothetical protein [Hydrogenobaculum sp.]
MKNATLNKQQNKRVGKTIKSPKRRKLKAVNIKNILNLYKDGNLSFSKTKEILNMNIFSFIELLRKNKLPINTYDEKELENDLITIKELMKN